MTNPGIVGPGAPLARTPLQPGSPSTTYGYAPVFDPATNQIALRLGGAKFRPDLSLYNGEALRRFRAQVAKALTSTSVATIVCPGDSITQGVTSTPQRTYNWPARLRSILAADGRFGTVGEGASFNTGATETSYDERWTLGTGWSWVTGGLLNHSAAQSAPGGGSLSFVLPTTADTVTIYYIRHSIAGTWTWNINGGATTGVAANGATALLSTTFTITPGVNTLNITPHATTGYAMIIGVRWAIAASPNDVEVFTGGGFSGQTSSQLVSSSGFGHLETIDLLQPDLTIICMGRNDAAAGGNIASFRANMATAILRSRTTNSKDVLLLAPPPANVTSTGTAYPLNAAMRAATFELADTYDVALLDLDHLFGANWNVAPYSMSGDNIHPNDAGSYRLGQAVANVLLNA